jgi:ornithine decarboxylase
MTASPVVRGRAGRAPARRAPTRPSRRATARATSPWIDPFEPAHIRRLVAQFGSPLLIVDCERVRQQFRALSAALPGVDLHYALKPLPHPAVVRAIVDEGGGLDLATTGEVELVARMGVDPRRCIHTHPIKRDIDIRAALNRGVRVMVADNPDEVRKFAPYAGRAELLLRVSFRSPGAVCDLSRKFGCDPENLLELARLANSLGIEVRGLSFHVGSQAADPGKHVEAIESCAALMAAARRERLGSLDTLDIGGGFPIDYAQRAPAIDRFCEPLREALRRLPRRVRVIAEPGRFIAGPSAIGVATVMGRAQREGHWWYYLDDGLYGSYSGQLFDHARYPVEALPARADRDDDARADVMRLPSVLAGPTCDSIDVIAENLLLPPLAAGDLIVGRAMGAYTWASASDFNFFPRARVVSVNLAPGDRGAILPVEL